MKIDIPTRDLIAKNTLSELLTNTDTPVEKNWNEKYEQWVNDYAFIRE